MNKGLNISISGGVVSLGAVSQGNASQVTGTAHVSQERVETYASEAARRIDTLAAELQISPAVLAELQRQLGGLKEKALAAPEDVEGGKALLDHVRAHFGWAYPVLKDLAKAIWPSLAGMLGL